MLLLPIIKGYAVGASLIVAIGPQNTFVIQQGIKRQHILSTVLVCCLTDGLLISLGVIGLGGFFSAHPTLIFIAKWIGAIFLISYGTLAFRSALNPSILATTKTDRKPKDIKKIIAILLGLSLLNPHCYLDTVVLIGSLSSQQAGNLRYLFGLGAILASISWFSLIAYGAKLLTPLFKSAIAWRVLDTIIGCTMMIIAATLIF